MSSQLEYRCQWWMIVLLVFLCSLAGCGRKTTVNPPSVSGPSPGPAPGPTPAPTPAPSAETRSELPALPSPSIRIGLASNGKEVRIAAPGDFYLVEKVSEAPRHRIRGEINVRIEHDSGNQTSEVYRIQVAALSNGDRAERLKKTLTREFSLPAVIQTDSEYKLHQVQLGEFSNRRSAQEFARSSPIRTEFSDAFVVRDSRSAREKTQPVLALRGPESLFRVATTGYLILPSSSSGFLRLDGKTYRGFFDLSPGKNGRLTVVNQLSMEEYLFGVVPGEISPRTYPEDSALRAQAIAARTYALNNMGRFSDEGFDLTDDVRTQVYGGVSIEQPTTNDAVRETYGITLYYKGKPINAMYSADCGGKTEDYANVFDAREVPYLRSVKCPSAGASGHVRRDRSGGKTNQSWKVSFTLKEVSRRLRRLSGDIGPLVDMEPAQIGKSGRAVQIRLIGTEGSTEVNGYRVRRALGLRDTLFSIHQKKNADGTIATLSFHGRGFGHGVGLCQIGAVQMARAGANYEEILMAYYSGVKIQKAY